MVLGATNLPWELDPAIIWRFPKRIYIPLPDEQAWEYLIRHSLRREEHLINDNQFKELAKITEGYSGSDLSILMKGIFYASINEF